MKPYAKLNTKVAMDRKAELERKKAKLAAIREEKERRRREKEAKDIEDATNKLTSGHDKDSTRYEAVDIFYKTMYHYANAQAHPSSLYNCTYSFQLSKIEMETCMMNRH